MEILRGTLARYLRAPEPDRAGGFASILYESGSALVPAKVSGPFSARMRTGNWFTFHGEWRTQKYKGRDEDIFGARFIRPDMPTTRNGFLAMLENMFDVATHGITRDSIRKFVSRHGEQALRAIERDPMMLLEMCSDPAAYGAAILLEWGRRNSGRRAVSLMEAAGFPPKAVGRVLDEYRDDAIDVIKSDPYRLVGIGGVEFDAVDRLGQTVGIARDDPRRVAAAVSEAVLSQDGAGHTYTPLSDLSDVLRIRGIDANALKPLIRRNRDASDDGSGGIHLDNIDGSVVAQNDGLFRGERRIAVRIASMMARRMPEAVARRIEGVTDSVLENEKYARFDDVQRQAVRTSVMGTVSVLTGGPGTGKSTVSEAIAEIAAATAEGPVILMAPTGKASRRLAEATNRDAQTVHRSLEARMEGRGHTFLRNASNPLPAGCFVIVDEASMLDVETAAALLDAIPSDGRLLLVGDRGQLPSVGPGYVLGDILAARAANGMHVPSSELVNVYRTDRNSSIAKGAALIRNGEIPPLDNKIRGGLVLFEHKTPLIVDRISNLVTGPVQRQLNLDPRTDVAILCPQAPGPAGTWEINARLSLDLNPSGARIDGIVRGDADNPRMPLPRVGDRVMLTRNDPEHDVMNGDVGTLVDAYAAKSRGGRDQRLLKVAFDTGQVVDFPLSRWRDLIPAYAITGHKSQGSQYRLVVMPLSMAHAKMLERTLVYTQWTRAQDFLMLVGEREALELAAATVTASERRTRLRSFLEATMNEVAPAPPPRRMRPVPLGFKQRRSPAQEPQGPAPGFSGR